MTKLPVSFFSPLKQRHAGKIVVFSMYPPLALALLRGKKSCFRRNERSLWRTVELLQMDLLCSVASPCCFQRHCQTQGRTWPSKQQSWNHICGSRVRVSTGSAEHRSIGEMGATFWFRCRFAGIFNSSWINLCSECSEVTVHCTELNFKLFLSTLKLPSSIATHCSPPYSSWNRSIPTLKVNLCGVFLQVEVGL